MGVDDAFRWLLFMIVWSFLSMGRHDIQTAQTMIL